MAGATGMAGFGVLKRLLEVHPETALRALYHTRQAPTLDDPRVEYVAGDLTDRGRCAALLAGCDVAINTAAATGGAQSLVSEPWAQVTDNVVMNLRFLEACANAGLRRVVMVGSATLYQDSSTALGEGDLDLNQDPPAPYLGVGWAYRTVESLSKFWAVSGRLPVVSARVSNIYGPYAAFHPSRSNVIPALIRRAVEREDPMVIWGRPDVVRDVVYVDDFSDAIVQLLDAEGIDGEAFNVGSGVPVTVEELVRIVLRCSGHAPSELRFDASRPATVPFRLLDCRRIAERVGWRARTPLEDGILRTVRWWEANRTTWDK